MGLHPWEFERYTYHEFVAKYKGYEAAKLETIKAIDESIRWAAYCQIVPGLADKYKKLPLDKLVPNRFEKHVKPDDGKVKRQIARALEYSRQMDRKKQKNAG